MKTETRTKCMSLLLHDVHDVHDCLRIRYAKEMNPKEKKKMKHEQT